MQLQLTRHFTFEMAHALPAYDGKCRNIHGHSYHLSVTVAGTPSQQAGDSHEGMVMDFHQLQQIVEERILRPFDHSLVLPLPADGAPHPTGHLGGFAAQVVWVPWQPTTENLLLHFARLLQGHLPAPTRLHSLSLAETDRSEATLVL